MTKLRESLAKTLLVAFSISSATLYITGYANAQSSTYMSRSQCSRLTGSNYMSCCLALNRLSIMTPDQIDQCPPWTTEAINEALTGGYDGSESSAVPGTGRFHHHRGGDHGGHHGGGHHGGGDHNHGGGHHDGGGHHGDGGGHHGGGGGNNNDHGGHGHH